MLAPEYGGDGGKAVGVCASKTEPVAAFPAHWAPNDLAIYTAKAFPAAYQGRSLRRLPRLMEPLARGGVLQDGLQRGLQPLKDGKASRRLHRLCRRLHRPRQGDGRRRRSGPPAWRSAPTGRSTISDDVKGRIWKVTYQGQPGAPLTSAPAPVYAEPAPQTADAGALPTPPGATAAQVAAGMGIFKSKSCAACHGQDAAGGPIGPPLNTGSPLWTDGGLASISDLISKGVPTPKQYRSPMPPMGGSANLSAR